MSKPDLLGPWIRRFLLEDLVGERNFSDNTRRSYRDTFCLLIPFLAAAKRKSIDQLVVTDISADATRLFLGHLEKTRKCRIGTRNQRLAAIRSLARFIGGRSPENLGWCSEVCGIPFKKAPREGMFYLEKPELDALLDAPDKTTRQGIRDHTMLLFLYNSGARASEAVGVKVGDLDLPESGQATVRLMGKGSKVRRCPLWASTAIALRELIANRRDSDVVFLNRCSRPITRFGVHALVARYVQKVAQVIPALNKKRVSPHSIRHTTATHLLRAGVDINTIRSWLGHVSVETTNIYAEIDMEAKARALAKCAVQPAQEGAPAWKENKSLMVFLRTL
jgi:site-specific recombinase XerD